MIMVMAQPPKSPNFSAQEMEEKQKGEISKHTHKAIQIIVHERRKTISFLAWQMPF